MEDSRGDMGIWSLLNRVSGLLIVVLLLCPVFLLPLYGLKNTLFISGGLWLASSLLVIIIFFCTVGRTLLNKYWISKELDNPKADTAIIISKINWFNPKEWLVCSYSYNFKDFFKLLRVKNVEYAVFPNLTMKEFDEIMYNKKYKNIHLFGHGARHTFVLDENNVIYYCKYANKKIEKDFVGQWHCNHNGGSSLADYVVFDKRKKGLCEISNDYRWLFSVNSKIKKMYKNEREIKGGKFE